MKNLLKLTLLSASLGVAGFAQAETLDVNATVAPICSITLNQVSSGTLSVAEEDYQTIANLDLKCNGANGAELEIAPANGDLKSSDNILINYTMRLDVTTVTDLSIAPTDTSPGSTHNSSTAGFNGDLAQGVPAVFKMDVNVEAPGPFVLGQTLFPARSAPAGDYQESFDFTLTAI